MVGQPPRGGPIVIGDPDVTLVGERNLAVTNIGIAGELDGLPSVVLQNGVFREDRAGGAAEAQLEPPGTEEEI